jgi:hypothetical protein
VIDGVFLAGIALLACMPFSAFIAILEYRRRNLWLAGTAAICFGLCIAAFVTPIPTHAVKIDLPAPPDGG